MKSRLPVEELDPLWVVNLARFEAHVEETVDGFLPGHARRAADMDAFNNDAGFSVVREAVNRIKREEKRTASSIPNQSKEKVSDLVDVLLIAPDTLGLPYALKRVEQDPAILGKLRKVHPGIIRSTFMLGVESTYYWHLRTLALGHVGIITMDLKAHVPPFEHHPDVTIEEVLNEQSQVVEQYKDLKDQGFKPATIEDVIGTVAETLVALPPD